MLDESDDAAGHEPRRADRLASACDLNHLDDAAACRDLDSTPGARRDDLVGARAIVCGYHDFDAIALHTSSVVRPVRITSPSRLPEASSDLSSAGQPIGLDDGVTTRRSVRFRTA